MQDPPPLPYLTEKVSKNYDISLEVLQSTLYACIQYFFLLYLRLMVFPVIYLSLYFFFLDGIQLIFWIIN